MTATGVGEIDGNNDRDHGPSHQRSVSLIGGGPVPDRRMTDLVPTDDVPDDEDALFVMWPAWWSGVL